MPRPDSSPPSLTLTAPEVAELLGLDVKTVYAGAKRGEIPARRVGRRYVFSRQAIEDWLSRPCDTIEGPTSRRRKQVPR